MTLDLSNPLELAALFCAVVAAAVFLVELARLIWTIGKATRNRCRRRRLAQKYLSKTERQQRREMLDLQAKRDASVAWLGDRYVFAPRDNERRLP